MVDRKEIAVCLELQRWFESKGVKCWLNEGEHKFTTKGLTREKPDLVIYSPHTRQYVAIEVKNGDTGKDIYDAMKILDYYQQYQSGTKYFIEEQEIKIDSFAVATLQSMFGKLFLDDGEPKSTEDLANSKDKWQYTNKLYGLEPRWEYPRTHQYIRTLWAVWRRTRKREYAPGLGIIVSDILNHEEIIFDIGQPLLFDMQWETLGKSPQWRVGQKWL